MQVVSGTVRCFLRDFYSFHDGVWGGTSPGSVEGLDGPTLSTRLLQFKREGGKASVGAASGKTVGPYTSTRDIGAVNGTEVKFVRIFARLAVTGRHGMSKKMPLRDLMQDLADTFNKAAKEGTEGGVGGACPGVATMVQSSGFNWAWMVTEAAFISGLMNGLLICFPVALGVLLFATRNVVVSVFATISIGCIVVSVLGLCKFMVRKKEGGRQRKAEREKGRKGGSVYVLCVASERCQCCRRCHRTPRIPYAQCCLYSAYSSVPHALLASFLPHLSSFLFPQGWELAIAESIAGVIVIGFSVDYVVHMGHMYVGKERWKDRKMRFSCSPLFVYHTLLYIHTVRPTAAAEKVEKAQLINISQKPRHDKVSRIRFRNVQK